MPLDLHSSEHLDSQQLKDNVRLNRSSSPVVWERSRETLSDIVFAKAHTNSTLTIMVSRLIKHRRQLPYTHTYWPKIWPPAVHWSDNCLISPIKYEWDQTWGFSPVAGDKITSRPHDPMIDINFPWNPILRVTDINLCVCVCTKTWMTNSQTET